MAMTLLKRFVFTFDKRKDPTKTFFLDPEYGFDEPKISIFQRDHGSSSPRPGDQANKHEPSSRRSAFCVSPRVISDATIGLSDGLTVPFALTAGLAALGSSRVVVFGGFAELIAGSISMGLGGYLGATAESEAYASLVSSTAALVQRYPNHAIELLQDSLAPLGIDIASVCSEVIKRSSPRMSPTYSNHDSTSSNDTKPARQSIDEPRLVQLLLRYVHLQPTAPPATRAYSSGLTIALAYFSGGFIPLMPYLFFEQVSNAFWWSVATMVVSLAAFGAGKVWLLMGERSPHDFEGIPGETNALDRVRRKRTRRAENLVMCSKGALQMVLLGGVAAGAAMSLVLVFDQGRDQVGI